MSSPDAALRRLVEVLDQLKIPFFVCGSVASSAHGVIRSTQDVDLVAGVQLRHIAGLVAELGEEFCVDPEMIRQALGFERSFNLIHFATGYKFDIFPLGAGPYDQAQFERRAPAAVSLEGAERIEVPLASAEDTLLSKLSWFRSGGEVSERQWTDIRGIVEIQGDRLDQVYLCRWAPHLHVEDLLKRALSRGGQG
jgi:hypothetical protein